ncbi:hypothetical protein Nepgr_022924 [Nepenthes gracilis]|uniref:Uncharacterized protein n=1 Tax=Nepenthes gracilis TaxID=150966 RepID=A0AAD3T1R5_NEPGR|nr:hypothetical protein Nepgr_022924 [Nepenthes gracilis]
MPIILTEKQKPAEAAPQARDLKPSRCFNHHRLQAQGPTADTAKPQGLIQWRDNSLVQKLNPNPAIRSNPNQQPPHHVRREFQHPMLHSTNISTRQHSVTELTSGGIL